MSDPKDRIPLRGSVRAPLPGARAVGAANPDQSITVTVMLRPRSSTQPSNLEEMGAARRERQHMTREQLEAASGADPQDIASIEAFAHEHQLSVAEASAAERRVVLSGTVANFSKAFDVELKRYEHTGGSYRGHTGSVHLPAEIANIVQGRVWTG